jgi:O-antigen/teichoic acid export membrane protein
MINAAILSGIILALSGSITSLTGIKDGSIVIYAAFILFFDALALVPFAYLRLNNKAKVFASIKIVNILVNVGLNLVLILVFKFGLVAVFISNLAASLITLLLLMPVILKNISFTFNSELFRELRKFSLPYLPAGLAAIIVQVIDKPIMQYLTDVKTVGIYSANYKLGIFMMLIVSMFEYAWRPFFLNNAKDPGAKPLFAKVLTIFVGAASIMFIVLTFFIDNIVEIPLPYKGHIIGEKYWQGLIIVPTVLFSYIFLGIYTNLMAGIYIEKKTRYLPLISGLGAVLNIIVCFALIPVMGIMGGAIATLVSYISMAVYIYYIAQKFYPIQYELGKIASMLFINALALGVFYGTYQHLDVIYKILLTAVLCGVIIYVSGLTQAKRLFQRS